MTNLEDAFIRQIEETQRKAEDLYTSAEEGYASGELSSDEYEQTHDEAEFLRMGVSLLRDVLAKAKADAERQDALEAQPDRDIPF